MLTFHICKSAVIPRPFNLDQINHETNAFKTAFVNVKCCSRQFLEETDTIDTEPEQKSCVNLTVQNQSKHNQILPVRVIADLTKITDANQAHFNIAASDMASGMTCEAVEHLEQVQLHQNLHRKAAKKVAKPHGTFAHPLQSLNPAEAEQEMNIAFQKSNDLKHVSVNLSTSIGLINHSNLIDENRKSPPLRDITLDAFSQKNKNLVVHAVHLHDNCNNPELCDGCSDKGKMRKKARVLDRAMSTITREVRRNPLGCSKDVFENADIPAQINWMPYPEDGCKMWKCRGSPSIKRYPQEREWSGQKIT